MSWNLKDGSCSNEKEVLCALKRLKNISTRVYKNSYLTHYIGVCFQTLKKNLSMDIKEYVPKKIHFFLLRQNYFVRADLQLNFTHQAICLAYHNNPS